MLLVISNDQNKPVNVDVAIPQNLRDIGALGPLININFHFHK